MEIFATRSENGEEAGEEDDERDRAPAELGGARLEGGDRGDRAEKGEAGGWK